jgi:hypothetical protein
MESSAKGKRMRNVTDPASVSGEKPGCEEWRMIHL